MRTLVVVGAVNVDLVVRAPRLPGPGETVVGPEMRRFGGGKGANAAVAAARAAVDGVAVRYAGAVGDDELGTSALAELRAAGVDVSAVAVVDGIATGVALIVVDERGENQIAVGAGANGRVDPGTVRAAVEGAAAVLVSTEIPADAVVAAVETAAAAGVVCVLNPAPVLPELAGLLDHGPVLTPNAGELTDLAAAAGLSGDTPAATAAALAGRTGAPVVVTLGGGGVLVAEPGHEPVHLPAEPVTVVDTTGAGDAFNGTLAARLTAGDDVVAAARAANAAAARAVTTSGARG
ncbi:PfkB family carbohydrate kinase [Pseudonocardia sp. CA-107938]|uniref:PfkB family carbohydrate kinase n=1 Tax=Pseudonocardia sp. CA-107938 TaxID=3240021 RepID=UPI003D8D6383